MDLSDTIKQNKINCAKAKDRDIESPVSVISSNEKNDVQKGRKSKRSDDFYNITKDPEILRRAALSLSPKKTFEAIIPPLKDISKKTLILDLDETLVHSSFDGVELPDLQIPIEIDGNNYKINVMVRPQADYFIKELSKYFEIIIYTASLSKYADPLISKLDPSNIVSHRLFREHCTYMDGVYIKDLSKLGRDLKNTIIIDNSAESYLLQPFNGLPIKSWYDDKDDIELKKFIPILINLTYFHDMRVEIGKIVADDTMNWSRIDIWLKKSKKKDKDHEKKNSLTCNIDQFEISFIDADTLNGEYEKLHTETTKKTEKFDKSKEYQTNPVNDKPSENMKQMKIIRNIFNLKPPKKIVMKADKKTKHSNTNSNLETTVNNNTINNTIQYSGVNNEKNNKTFIPTSIKKKTLSTPKSNLIKINYKINSLYDSFIKKKKNHHSNSFQKSNPKTGQKNESSHMNNTLEENQNKVDSSKTRNIVVPLKNDKTYRTNTALHNFLVTMNNSVEDMTITHTAGNDENEITPTPNKKKSSNSINKTAGKVLSYNTMTKANINNNAIPINTTLSKIPSSTKNSKPSEMKSLSIGTQIRKKSTSRQSKEIATAKDNACQHPKIDYPCQQPDQEEKPMFSKLKISLTPNSKKITDKRKMIEKALNINRALNMNKEIDYSRNVNNEMRSNLIASISSVYKINNTNNNNLFLQSKNIKKNEISNMNTTSHKKNISFKF